MKDCKSEVIKKKLKISEILQKIAEDFKSDKDFVPSFTLLITTDGDNLISTPVGNPIDIIAGLFSSTLIEDAIARTKAGVLKTIREEDEELYHVVLEIIEKTKKEDSNNGIVI